MTLPLPTGPTTPTSSPLRSRTRNLHVSLHRPYSFALLSRRSESNQNLLRWTSDSNLNLYFTDLSGPLKGLAVHFSVWLSLCPAPQMCDMAGNSTVYSEYSCKLRDIFKSFGPSEHSICKSPALDSHYLFIVRETFLRLNDLSGLLEFSPFSLRSLALGLLLFRLLGQSTMIQMTLLVNL